MRFKAFDKSTKHIYYRQLHSRRDTQRILPGFNASGDLAKNPDLTLQQVAFQLTTKPAETIGAAVTYEADRVYFGADKGTWVFNFGFDSAQSASISIALLPLGATAWLFDQSPSGKVYAKAEGTGGPAILATTQQITNPRLVVREAQASSPATNSTVVTFASVEVDSSISADFIIAGNWQISDHAGPWVLPILNHRESFVGDTYNTGGGQVERSAGNAFLYVHRGVKSAGYKVLDAAAYRATPSAYFPLGTLMQSEREREFDFYASDPSSTSVEYRRVTIDLPTEKPVAAEVLLCNENWTYSGGCEPVRQILASQQQNGRKLTVTPLEPIVNREVIVRVLLPQGTTTASGLLTQLRYEAYHFWHFGGKPMWAKWIYALCILGLMIAGVVVIVRVLGHFKEKRLQREAAARALQHKAEAQKRSEEHQKRVNATLRDLRERDPKFDLDAFYRRGREIATRIQQSWSAGDMRDGRRFLSQGVYNRFRLQLKIMREVEKRRNLIADFRIRNFYVLTHNRSGEFDCLTVRLDAEARDIWVTLDTPPEEAQKALANASVTRFVEFYSFMRRASATSDQEQPLGNCSHCGTPFPRAGETNKCKNCGAVMGSGEFDWVLAEITQESEYKGYRGNQELTQGLSPDRLEDRASYVFWRDAMARLTGDAIYIRRDATDGYLGHALKRQPLYDIAVGAVDVEAYEDKGDAASARVLVKWSAADEKGSAVRHRRSVLFLHAQPDHLSGTGFADPGCPSCGAPLPETDSETCAYCRSAIARKNPDWLLDKIETTVE